MGSDRTPMRTRRARRSQRGITKLFAFAPCLPICLSACPPNLPTCLSATWLHSRPPVVRYPIPPQIATQTLPLVLALVGSWLPSSSPREGSPPCTLPPFAARRTMSRRSRRWLRSVRARQIGHTRPPPGREPARSRSDEVYRWNIPLMRPRAPPCAPRAKSACLAAPILGTARARATIRV